MSLLDNILRLKSKAVREKNNNILKLKKLDDMLSDCQNILTETNYKLIKEILEAQILEDIETLCRMEWSQEDINFCIHISRFSIILETPTYRHMYDSPKMAALDVYRVMKNETPEAENNFESTVIFTEDVEMVTREKLIDILETYTDIIESLRKKSLFAAVFLEELYLQFYISQYQI